MRLTHRHLVAAIALAVVPTATPPGASIRVNHPAPVPGTPADPPPRWGRREAGTHARGWDLRDDHGRRVPAGIYRSRPTVGGWAETRRVAVFH
jgi:hypothetical protein